MVFLVLSTFATQKETIIPARLQFDNDMLVAAVGSGQPAKAIMNRFGLKITIQFKAIYLDAFGERSWPQRPVMEVRFKRPGH